MNFNKDQIYLTLKNGNKTQIVAMKDQKAARYLCSSYNYTGQVKL